MNIINLAITEVEREGKSDRPDIMGLVLDRATRIRRYLDRLEIYNRYNKKRRGKRWKKAKNIKLNLF